MSKTDIVIDLLRTVVIVNVDPNLEGDYTARAYPAGRRGGDDFLVIKIESRTSSPKVIAHEACHAAAFICEDKGLSVQFDHLELVAYIVEYVVGRVCK